MSYTQLGRIRPVYKGTWNASTAYTALEMVKSTDGRKTYIALKNVPAGTALTNTSYWASVLDVSDVIEAVEAATSDARAAESRLDEKLELTSTDLERMTDGHFRRIPLDTDHDVVRYYETSGGEVVAYSAIKGSDYIKCPRHLCIHFSDANARCFLYFYRLVGSEYVVAWDIYKTEGEPNSTTGNKTLNYLSAGNTKTYMIDIPEDVYMQAAVYVADVNLYGWDGEPFGVPVSADPTIKTASGGNYPLNEGGSSGIVIPGNAEFVCCGDSSLFAIVGYKDGEMEILDDSAKRRFWVPPKEYDFFRARLYFGSESDQSITRVGDASDLVSIVTDNRSELPSARARKVVEACQKVCGMKWTPKSNFFLYKLSADDETGRYSFKSGVEYNGIPYGSQWFSTHYVGWHVSPHTYINAISDTESAIYKETVRSWPDIETNKNVVSYYGIVCSAFAAMCDGWPYPQTNAGFVYDPMVTLSFAANPPLGAIFSNLDDHCLIPERVDHVGDVDAVGVYEAANPVCGKRTRYSNIDIDADECSFNSAFLDGYLDGYGYVAHHIKASGTLDSVPYANFDDVDIVAAGALPYKGDRCVYTSEDEHVYINIKDSSAATLVLTAPNGTTKSISISGASRIDIEDYLSTDGIYYVHTDTNSTQSTFEYHTVNGDTVEPITYTLTGGVISFSRNDFWYAMCVLRGDKFFTGGEWCAVPCRTDGDYSDWSRDGHSISSAKCVFYKGEYGAYPAPLTHA